MSAHRVTTKPEGGGHMNTCTCGREAWHVRADTAGKDAREHERKDTEGAK